MKINSISKVVVNISLTKLYQDRTNNLEDTGKISSIPLSEVWLSLYRFPQSSQPLHGIVWNLIYLISFKLVKKCGNYS